LYPAGRRCGAGCGRNSARSSRSGGARCRRAGRRSAARRQRGGSCGRSGASRRCRRYAGTRRRRRRGSGRRRRSLSLRRRSWRCRRRQLLGARRRWGRRHLSWRALLKRGWRGRRCRLLGCSRRWRRRRRCRRERVCGWRRGRRGRRSGMYGRCGRGWRRRMRLRCRGRRRMRGWCCRRRRWRRRTRRCCRRRGWRCRTRRWCRSGWRRRCGMRRRYGRRLGGRCGRRGRALRRRLGFSVGAQFFLGSLRHNERRGLRMRCEGCELRHGQSRRGKQHDAKFCHDVLDPRKNLAARLAGKSGFRRTFRRVDQRLIVRPDCGGLQNANAIYFDSITGCMRSCSLRIQTMLSNRTFTLSPVASLRRWYGVLAACLKSRNCRHRFQAEARSDRSVRGPAVRPASCPVTPLAATARRVHVSG